MAPMELLPRRAIFAFGIAIVTLAAPAAATLAGGAPTVAPRILAGPCATHLDPGNAELNCEPPAVHETAGAPTEMGLTGTHGTGSLEYPATGAP